ncbi:ATP-binding protein [Starkeya sp. ORNL1]|nr:ATP-binding protein [Starkeya sp. ORNL1]
MLSGSLQALLRALCDELGVVPGGSIHDVESRLLKFYYSTPVVILDEAQNLPLKSLRQLLHLSVADEGDIVFIFCGNSEVRDFILVSRPSPTNRAGRVEDGMPRNDAFPALARMMVQMDDFSVGVRPDSRRRRARARACWRRQQRRHGSAQRRPD